MDKIKFKWDPKKEVANAKKHRVSFEEASTVFYDSNAIEFFDPEHSENEDRFLMLGVSWQLRILVVSFCFPKKTSTIRINSARKATKREQAVYTGDTK